MNSPGIHTTIMKLLITIALAALAALITPHVIAAEAPAPMTLSLVTRTNDAAGKPVVRFRLSSTADAPYNYYMSAYKYNYIIEFKNRASAVLGFSRDVFACR